MPISESEVLLVYVFYHFSLVMPCYYFEYFTNKRHNIGGVVHNDKAHSTLIKSNQLLVLPFHVDTYFLSVVVLLFIGRRIFIFLLAYLLFIMLVIINYTYKSHN